MIKGIKIMNDAFMILFILYSFLFAGFLQFFLGVSNTIVNVLLIYFFLIWYFIRPRSGILKNQLNFIFFSIVIILYIFIISIIKGQGFLRALLYSQFFLVPVALLLLIYQKDNDSFKSFNLVKIRKWLIYLALFQTPVLLFQRYGYDFLMKFNNSGKIIYHVDFMFGTFPLKNDHSLGFLFVCVLMYIWGNNIFKYQYQRYLTSLIIMINILLTNSNASVFYLLIVGMLLILYKNKQRLLSLLKKVILISLIIVILFFLIDYFEPKFYLDLRNKLDNRFEIRDALKWYSRGLARREQIILVLFHEGVNYFGNGAYSYFDILTGKFAKTFRHFSQLIWTYYDLGIIGLLLLSRYFFSINKLLNKERVRYNFLLTIGLFIFSFFSIVTFDVSFMLTYFIFKRKNED